MSDNFISRILAATAAAVLVVILWHTFPLMQAGILSRWAEPRAITPRGDLAEDEKSTIAIFEGARNSVVFITTAERVLDPWSRKAYEVARGSGSGFVWDALGHVVTNQHVIEGASRAIVRLVDGRAFPAYLVGAVPEHDLAVLQIGVGADRPAPIKLGTSSDLKVGQKVFAIGNPFGLDWTMTTGIVSALDREIPGRQGGAIRGLIQTDAAINPGNSGGPLLDSAGRLIGVNTAIYSPSGTNAGIGFAVPADTVNRVVPQLIAKGRYSPPTLGIRIDPKGDLLLRQFGLAGVLVLDVVPGSGAAAAGLKPARVTSSGQIEIGDVIVSLDEKPIKSAEDLFAELDQRRPGEEVRLGLLREGRNVEVRVVLKAAS